MTSPRAPPIRSPPRPHSKWPPPSLLRSEHETAVLSSRSLSLSLSLLFFCFYVVETREMFLFFLFLARLSTSTESDARKPETRRRRRKKQRQHDVGSDETKNRDIQHQQASRRRQLRPSALASKGKTADRRRFFFVFWPVIVDAERQNGDKMRKKKQSKPTASCSGVQRRVVCVSLTRHGQLIRRQRYSAEITSWNTPWQSQSEHPTTQ